MESVVISLGGSIISGDPLNVKFLGEFCREISKFEKKTRFGIVVGGGKLARNYISSLRVLKVNDHVLDEIGIHATRMNALATATFLKDVNHRIPTSINDAAELMNLYSYTVMGGTEPGHTTDTVAALLAERVGAKKLINATSVDGVYSDDPKKNPNAKKILRLSHDEAISLSLKGSIGAGPSVFMDLTSLNIAKRSNIEIYVIDGSRVSEYGNILENGKTSGTLISG
ncbi:MAG: UMP kinase [Candidatus Thermoplasmatota archaeon]|jgi:uridylate kinase|nr:UMP kinase [Candidatus Thermoplasmatota archaeon]MCL5785554.1 UMP kinase [Candidatus Thermoplasmatota archaeon]